MTKKTNIWDHGYGESGYGALVKLETRTDMLVQLLPIDGYVGAIMDSILLRTADIFSWCELSPVLDAIQKSNDKIMDRDFIPISVADHVIEYYVENARAFVAEFASDISELQDKLDEVRAIKARAGNETVHPEAADSVFRSAATRRSVCERKSNATTRILRFAKETVERIDQGEKFYGDQVKEIERCLHQAKAGAMKVNNLTDKIADVTEDVYSLWLQGGNSRIPRNTSG